MSASQPHQDEEPDDAAEMLNPNDAAEIIDEDGDAAMDSGADGGDDVNEEIQLQNDSSASFDHHPDSIFCIAQHPLLPHIIATGGSEGEDLGGIGYIFDSTPEAPPVLPASYQAAPSESTERKSLAPIYKLEGHTDSINALAFSLPTGKFLLSGGLDGRLRVYTSSNPTSSWTFLTESQEVPEINWLAPCPNSSCPNTIALGASDGSVWVYTIDLTSLDAPLQIVQSYFLHTASCTAGSWSPDGNLLATVSEDSSLYVWDVFGAAATAGLTQGLSAGQIVVGLTAEDHRFAVEGGLYSVAIAPSGAFVAVGGAGGAIKVIGLPRLSNEASGAAPAGRSGAGAALKTKGGKQIGGKASGAAASAGQTGQILADLQAQSEGIETLAFAPPPLTLLAAGSVDGSICLFDTARNFAVRRHIKEAHEEYSVVKVESGQGGDGKGWLLTSCGMDGVVRRWDTRGGTGQGGSWFMREWKGHRGDGEGGGVLGFVQGDGGRIVTAGDDGVALVFEAGNA